MSLVKTSASVRFCRRVAMLDKIWQGTLDTPKIIVLSHEVHFVKSYNHAII